MSSPILFTFRKGTDPLSPGFINHLNAKLDPICLLLALFGAHHILHISRIRVKPPILFVPLPNPPNYMPLVRKFIDGLENFSITGYPEATTWLRSPSDKRNTKTTVQFLIILTLYIISGVYRIWHRVIGLPSDWASHHARTGTSLRKWKAKHYNVTFRRIYATIFAVKSDGYYILWVYIFSLIGFGGLEVACWPLVPKFAGSNPTEAVGFLRAKKSSARLPSEGK